MFIPEGTAIGHNSCAMMRRADIFGQDVEIFRPERFLECSSEQRLEMDRTIDVHFGAGRWQCAGKQLAHTELNKMYFEVSRSLHSQSISCPSAHFTWYLNWCSAAFFRPRSWCTRPNHSVLA